MDDLLGQDDTRESSVDFLADHMAPFAAFTPSSLTSGAPQGRALAGSEAGAGVGPMSLGGGAGPTARPWNATFEPCSCHEVEGVRPLSLGPDSTAVGSVGKSDVPFVRAPGGQNQPPGGIVPLFSGGEGYSDLDIMTAQGEEYPEGLEDAPGGYVGQNTDNDNYNATELGDPISDMSEDGTVVGENDLVPIKIHAVPDPQPNEAFWVGWSANLRVWKYPDRSEAVVMSLEGFPTTVDTMLYVEGVMASDIEGDSVVAINRSSDGSGDEVRFTVVALTGPRNVPDYSKHTYSVLKPDTTEGSWEAVGGTIANSGPSN